MKIFIKSNFILPGLEKAESVDFDEAKMTMREFFEKLSNMTNDRIEFIETDSLQINPEDWEIEINGMAYHQYEKGLEHILKDGDTVGIKIMPIGGG